MKKIAAIISIFAVLGTVGFFGYNHMKDLEQDLSDSQQKISNLRENVDMKDSRIENLNEQIGSLNQEIFLRENTIENLEEKISAVKSELQSLKKGDRYDLHDPTYSEVEDFLQDDKTDQNEYIEGEYICVDYASDVNKNAMKEGIQCAFVDIRFPASAHAIVAFNTTDEGLIFVEPQNDTIIPDLEQGQEYYQILDKHTSQNFVGSSNDLIQRIIIVW